jgi:glyoxylase-like metal-dependent hydrolase (beta-lactamase superfamily II)
MATSAQEISTVTNHLHLWQYYDATVKADLYSTAIRTEAGLFFVDPVPVRNLPLRDFVKDEAVVGVFVTNINHGRAAGVLAKNFSVPIFAHEAIQNAGNFQSIRCVSDREILADELRVIEIAGAPIGEMAIYHAADGGSFVVGDALINFEPYGFALLPPKYCEDAKKMRQSLRRLLEYEFDRMLFAHGTPLMHCARKKLEQLLQDGN